MNDSPCLLCVCLVFTLAVHVQCVCVCGVAWCGVAWRVCGMCVACVVSCVWTCACTHTTACTCLVCLHAVQLTCVFWTYVILSPSIMEAGKKFELGRQPHEFFNSKYLFVFLCYVNQDQHENLQTLQMQHSCHKTRNTQCA